jgi:hypothetical protein
VSEKYDRHTRDRTGDRDRCPYCGRPFVVVLEGASSDGGPARFVWCAAHDGVWVQAEGSQVPVVSRHARLLAREILRLRALVPPDQRDARDVARSVASAEEDGDPALPPNIGQAAQQTRRRREGEGAGRRRG